MSTTNAGVFLIEAAWLVWFGSLAVAALRDRHNGR